MPGFLVPVTPEKNKVSLSIQFLPMLDYDKYIVAFSGGKDCTASFLHLLDLGIPIEKIELWHHEIDGRETGTFMDWDCTPSYCTAFAKAFKVPLYFSWKEGGFEREMLRENSLTAPTKFENEKGEVQTVGGERGNLSTRRKFPQVSGDLTVRWCSAYLKIDICASAIRNQERFKGLRTVVISGERGEESTQRSRYATLEPDRSDLRDGKIKRHVDHWRPVKDWMEQQVWEIIERYQVRVHPCYYMGWSRCSCRYCIFGNKDQMASAYYCNPESGDKIIGYEKEFGVTIKRKKSMIDLISEGVPYDAITDELKDLSNSTNYDEEIFMDEWILPAGAYGEGCGPT